MKASIGYGQACFENDKDRRHVDSGGLMLFLLMLAAAAGPTYLKCSLDTDKGPFSVNIAADEANQWVTVEIPSTGAADRRPARYSATDVFFTVPIFRETHIEYQLSRVDLTLTRTLVGYDAHKSTTGKCAVQTPPARAF